MKKIIIAGAGFAGVRVALDLYRQLPEANIVVINKTPFHCYHPDLYEVATAILPKEQKIDFKNLRGTVNIPLETVFKDKKVELMIDTVAGVDLENNMVATQNSGTIEYDFLVLCLGSTTSYLGVEGAEEFSHCLKTAEDALNIRNDLEELVLRNKGGFSIVIAGGGFTGVEAAGQLTGFLDNLSRKYGNKRADITIIEASDAPLAGMPTWSQKLALERLKKLNVRLFLSHRIEKVEEGRIYCDDKERINFDYLIWTAGVLGVALKEKVRGTPFTKKQRILALPDMSLEKFPNVFVIGDLVECNDQRRGCPVPSAAWAAIGQGKIAAKNILARVENRQTQDYVPPSSTFVVPLDGKYALSNFAGLKITGILGWILKRMIALKYFLSILSFYEAFTIWRKGVKIYLAND
ncbi:MAG: NAD(P)/FAD-dependent oxidoreductase [bacterium]|nr:NAD(P)/FAD-dependent oxidoreductase [bacterium]